MRRTLLCTLAAGCLLSSVGCGTFLNQSPKGSYFNVTGTRRPYRVYGGVRTDLEVVFSPLENKAIEDVPFRVVYIVVDLPLSLVADTIALPFDVRQQWRRLYRPELYDEGRPIRPPFSDEKVVPVALSDLPPIVVAEQAK